MRWMAAPSESAIAKPIELYQAIGMGIEMDRIAGMVPVEEALEAQEREHGLPGIGQASDWSCLA